jgi:trimeric autotransporter adhesin
MKITTCRSRRCVSVSATFIILLLFTTQVNSQTFAFRNGWGDPVVAGTETGSAVAVDNSGNVYITGSFVGTVNFGTGNLTATGAVECFVAKFNSSGTAQWAIRIGGATNDAGLAIATDGAAVYVGGRFVTSMTVGTSPTSYPGASQDGFIVRLNASTGATDWVTTIGGVSTNADVVQALCLDASGNVYASGNFFISANFGPFTRNANGGSNSDLFAARLNPATGAFVWASTGGAASANDNPGGSGITYHPGTDEVLVTGSYLTNNATYSTTSPASSVTLNISPGAINDICLLEINASNGAFISGVGVGGTTAANEEGLAITYDELTQDIFFTGYFASASIQFGSNPAITNPNGNDDIFIARYNPSTNAFIWSEGSGSSEGADRGLGIASDDTGGILITGRFRGTLSFPPAAPITNTRVPIADDVFVARLNATNGDGQLLIHAPSANTPPANISSAGQAIAVGITNNAWITGGYGDDITFPPLPVLPNPSGGANADIFLARWNDPTPLAAGQSQTPITCNIGCDGTATVTPSGGATPYTFSWSPSGGSAATATGLCPNTYTVTITDAIGQQITRNFTITDPATVIASATTSNPSFTVSATNNIIADAACNLIARLQPNGAVPVSGTVNARVWREASVPTYGGKPFVQRHYEITPSTNTATATGRVTLYFTQVEFNNFNAHPASAPDLPTGPGDAAGIANLRIAKYPGTTSNGTGLPNSYGSAAVIIDPIDGDIVWNATLSRWEVSFNNVGFSGFIVQTSLVALPVSLLSFSGQLNNTDVSLKWTTTTEIENDYFEVERSNDGRNYVSVGRRQGSNGNTIRNYDLTDAGAAQSTTGKLFYRLKIVSMNGRVEYSNIVIVYLNKTGVFVNSILPNPFTNELKVSIDAPRSGNLDMSIVDMNGRVLIKQQTDIAKGFSTQSINGVDKLAAGVYTLLVNFDGEISAHKIVK